MTYEQPLNKELISVIVPVYNTEQYLRPCLDSILNQSCRAFELLLIDDGSTDRSGQICEEYQKLDPRIRVFHKKNGGLSSARNYGMQKAEGSYICFVDSDDLVAEEYLEILYRNAKHTGADISWCGFSRFSDPDDLPDAETVCPVHQPARQELWYRLSTVGPECVSTTFVVAWNKLIKKEKLAGLTFPEGKWHEDEFFCHRLLNGCDSFAETSQPLYFYRQRHDSIVGSDHRTDIRHLDALEAYQERIRYCRQQKDPDLYRAIVNAYRENCIILYASFCSGKQNLKTRARIKGLFFKSFFQYPIQRRFLKRQLVFFWNAGLYYRKYWGN